MIDKNGFNWKFCELCDGPCVICNKCGNNCCNGGTNKLESGEQCGCKEAYEYQDLVYENNLQPIRSDFPPEDIMDGEIQLLDKIFGKQNIKGIRDNDELKK